MKKLFFVGVLVFTALFLTSLGMTMKANATELTSRPTVLILLGPPGSGKGTQAVRLSKELGIPHISTGDLFRDNMSRNTELGKRAKSYMESGQLVPDELVLEMLFDRVSRPDCIQGYLLDGFPRTLPQAEALDKHLQGKAKIIALNLQVKDEAIVKRAEGRLTCKSCGAVYNKYYSPSKQENVCDQCEGDLIQRTDDKAEVVQERLRVYHKQTAPLIEYYQKKGVLAEVNGEQKPDEVFSALLKQYQIVKAR